ncbi:MAG: hypothetical protein CK540_04370 [Thermoleophilia bacterium]|nr:MAG: hypothetical protein CK540_04370 [Thermoleophilia bacterium]
MTERRRDPQAALRLPSPIASDIRGAVPPDLGPVRRILGVWNETVGAGLARFAQPARITREGVLIVHAADASWVHAITLEQRTILKKLKEQLAGDAPTELRVEIGLVDTRVPEAPPEPTPIQPAAQKTADEMVAGIDDPRLKAALSRAIARSLSRGSE